MINKNISNLYFSLYKRGMERKITRILIFLFFPILMVAQTPTENYIKTTTYKIATTTSIASPTPDKAMVNIVYLDGLGRPKQKIASQQSGTGTDIISYLEYDEYGRQAKEYLPFASSQTTMNYIDAATLKQNILTQYQTKFGDANPYSQKQFDFSPLNRVVRQATPGNDWALNSHDIKIEYQTNVAADQVKLYMANANWNPNTEVFDISLINGTGTVYYSPSQLTKTIIKNENWTSGKNNTKEEFKDKEGRVVLVRTYSDYGRNNTSYASTNEVAHDIYTVYDQFGNITYVIPALVTNANTQLNSLCFQYKYDGRNRLVEKKIPGKQWEFIVYDKLNRPVLTGPALPPFTNLQALTTPPVGWMLTKYDTFGRPAYLGWVQATAITSAERKNLQTTQNGALLYETKSNTSTNIDGIMVNYTNTITPTSFKLLSVNYYDDYFFPDAPNPIPSAVLNDVSQNVYYNATIKPKNLLTGNWTRVLQNSTDLKGETTYILYDYKARPIRSYSKNYLTGYTLIDKKIDFSGKILYTETKHKRVAASTEIYIKDVYTYTNQDRPVLHTHQVGLNGIPQLLSKNDYNEFGQLVSKKVGGTDVAAASYLQKVNYSYNIKGWLTGINDVGSLLQAGDPKDLFAFKINYNTVSGSVIGVKELYNGNVAETYWKTSSDNTLRKYGFEYDNLNRLKNATYQKPDAAVKITNSYNESLTYDKNGNIKTLQRNGEFDDAVNVLQIDNLTYTYDPNNENQLTTVADATASPRGFSDGLNTNRDYTYDANGNLLTDLNKGISTKITYNHLNLPTKIVFSTGNITYLYNATGQKLQKVVREASVLTTTDYCNGFQYRNTVLQYFPHAEGYVSNTVVNGANVYNYAYNYTDHLGNIRMTYGIDPATGLIKIMEENNYYPFGLKHNNYNMTQRMYNMTGQYEVGLTLCEGCSKPFNNKFNSKEYQDELSLNVTAMDFRQYDNAIGRFNCIDLLAERNAYQSTYQFGNNNPIFFSDPSGLDCTALIQALWDATKNGDRSYWVNGGNGNFDYKGRGPNGESGSGGSGGDSTGSGILPGTWVSSTGEFHAPKPGIFVQLQNVNCIASHDSSNWLSDVQSQVNGFSLNGLGNWESYAKVSEYGEVLISAQQLRMIDIRESMSVLDKIGNYRRFASKYERLGRFGGALGKVNNVVTVYNTYSDVRNYNNGQLSGERLSYRLSGTIASIGTATAVGSAGEPGLGTIAGFVVGLTSSVGEMVYDGWNNTVMPAINQGTYEINNNQAWTNFHP